ncbi:MAG: ribonuclease III [Deltaproteobacteria bacterium]|nr:ribonuclease III [Deltaproteobacteria bacterium]
MTNKEILHDLDSLTHLLDYSFNKEDLLYQALRHPSYVYEKGEAWLSDNQRLEFLGDAVISLAISHLLMESFPEVKEGNLSKYRAFLVSENGLHTIARKIKLGDYLFLGKGEEQTNGRKKPSILSDAFEALMGAIYLDGGFTNALKVASKLFGNLVNNIEPDKPVNDFKTELQEFFQENFQSVPEYRMIKEKGPDHNKTFYAAAYLNGSIVGKGKGKSKKEAEQNAAKDALLCLKK